MPIIAVTFNITNFNEKISVIKVVLNIIYKPEIKSMTRYDFRK